jgi:hypothetical protein
MVADVIKSRHPAAPARAAAAPIVAAAAMPMSKEMLRLGCTCSRCRASDHPREGPLRGESDRC